VEDRVKDLLVQIQQGQVCTASTNNLVCGFLNCVETREVGTWEDVANANVLLKLGLYA
jgi:hypothetical protein